MMDARFTWISLSMVRLGQRVDLGPVRLSYNPYFSVFVTVFFSPNKLVNNIFSHGFSAKRTGS
jgi:hypothetical protein